MTARGEGILAFLDCVLTEQERTLTPLVGLGTCPDWGHCQPECTHQFGINDSEAKLRRCAAERKMLELHRPKPDGSGFPDSMQCRTCSEDGGDGYQYLVYAPCPTILAIAEGYGWTEGER